MFSSNYVLNFRVPACNSKVPFSTDASWTLVSADAACAVGVDPTARTNGCSCAPLLCEFDKIASANPAAVFTASTSAERIDEACGSEVEA